MTRPNPTRYARDRWTFDRYDSWALATLLALVSLAAVVAGVVAPLVGWAGGHPLHVPYSGEVSVPALDAVNQPYSTARYDLKLNDPTTGQRLLALGPGVALATLTVACAVLVFAVMRDIVRGEPFQPRSVTRLRMLAGLVAVGLPVVWFVRATATGQLLSAVDLGGLPVATTVDIPVIPMLAGVTIALLAEAFRAGARLRDDVEGLI